MTLASGWLLAAMSEHGEPSARRVVMVVGLLIFAPALLAGVMRWAPGAIAECFIAYIAACGGVYVGGTFAGRGQVSSAPPAPKEAP